MRTFIILLLLTNLAYFGWNQGWLRELPPPATKTPVPAQPTAMPRPFEPPPHGLRLISELSESERAQLTRSPLPAAPMPDEPEQNQELGLEVPQPVELGPPWCATLGEFVQVADADALLPALAALGVTAELRSAAVPVSSMFWVYLPAFASDAETRRVLDELQSKQIDNFYMRDGQFAGGISLGVFSRRASAEAVQQALAPQGYTAQIGEVVREEQRSSLALRAPGTSHLEAPGWADLMAENPGLTLTENVCESVASDF